jgi:hypothetical protein
MRVDLHCHLGYHRKNLTEVKRFSFEPLGGYASFDSYMSDLVFFSPGLRMLRLMLQIPPYIQAEQQEEFAQRLLLRQIIESFCIDRAVILAFDQYHTNDGKPLGPRRRDSRQGSDLYVSNTFVRHLWKQYPQKLLFGASIHPYRNQGNKTAIDMLEEVVASGAVLIKWLPTTQNIDIEDPRTIEFIRRAADLNIPLLIHYGMEATLGNMHPRFADPSGLLRTLNSLRKDRAMPTVIIAHAATPVFWPVTPGRTFYTCIDALRGDFAEAPLYADTAALGLFSKAHWLKKLAGMPEIHHKLVYGSDFPIPPTPELFRFRLGKDYRKIKNAFSFIDRDIMLKSCLGVNGDTVRRSGQVLSERIKVADQITSQIIDKTCAQR